MIQAQDIKYGSRIEGSAFTFNEEGDDLHWHVHTEEANDTHIVIVARGKIRMETKGAYDTIQSLDFEAGDLLDIPPNLWHRFVGLTPGAKIFNLCKEHMNVST